MWSTPFESLYAFEPIPRDFHLEPFHREGVAINGRSDCIVFNNENLCHGSWIGLVMNSSRNVVMR
jgi:hypothetical protein